MEKEWPELYRVISSFSSCDGKVSDYGAGHMKVSKIVNHVLSMHNSVDLLESGRQQKPLKSASCSLL